MSTQMPTGENGLVGLFDPIPHRYMFLPGVDSALASRCAIATQAAGHPVYVVVDSTGRAMGLRVPHYILEPFLREDYSSDSTSSSGGLYIDDEPVYSDWEDEWPDEEDAEYEPESESESESDDGESGDMPVDESDDLSRNSSDPTSVSSDSAIDPGNVHDSDYDSGVGDMGMDENEGESSDSDSMRGVNWSI
ncbi:hypothetical protein GQX73_g2760 [Xylaria multiplex]|uniref:Uncharacterized protein n=1 Tax=Xylaria multiplex TaxID=323545 RepID=A0A7C8N891_9PEZI|nr:hypothetical protein GQX73_g2760 [Xylaria multiplex]